LGRSFFSPSSLFMTLGLCAPYRLKDPCGPFPFFSLSFLYSSKPVGAYHFDGHISVYFFLFCYCLSFLIFFLFLLFHLCLFCLLFDRWSVIQGREFFPLYTLSPNFSPFSCVYLFFPRVFCLALLRYHSVSKRTSPDTKFPRSLFIVNHDGCVMTSLKVFR